MTAIISGNTLGLSTSSLEVLGGQQGSVGQASEGRAGERVYVNSTIGNLVIQNRDDLLVGLGSLGARSSRIADVQERLANRSLDVESRRSLVEDVDVTTAVLELTRQQQTLQLAEATGAKIIQMTLPDYLR